MKHHLLSIALCASALLPLCATADDSLAVAAMQRDLDRVRQLLAERGTDVNANGPNATPALHWLVRIEELELTQRLLDAGADVNQRNGVGLAALSLAIENRDVDMVELLLQRRADATAPDAAGETPLMQAASSGSPEIVKAVLARGVDVNALEPHYQQNALMLGVRSSSPEVVELLLAAGSDVNLQTPTGGEPTWRLPKDVTASHGVGVNWGGFPPQGLRNTIAGAKTPLLYATREGNLDITKQLVAAGANIETSDANGDTPLLTAIINAAIASKGAPTQHLEVAHYLIDQGANIKVSDWYGVTPLWAAVDLRNLDVSGPVKDNRIDRESALTLIRTLLERGADPNAQVQQALPVKRWVTRLGHLSWVDVTGQTAFFRAAFSGDVTTMKLLVEHGADPNLATFNGTTPLMAAAGVDWTVSQTYDEGPEALREAVKLAHSLGNDVNAQNALGFAAVHGAANRGSDDIIRWLAANGAKLDIADEVGRTAVTWAHGVFLATHPPVDRPETVALIESLLAQQQQSQQQSSTASNP